MRIDINKLRKAIDEWSMQIPDEDIRIVIPANDSKKRDHLGMSTIANPCQKAVFFDYRKVAKKKFPPRILRLFQRGHREEFFFFHMLQGIGLKVYEIDPSTGKQFQVSAFEGHLAGSMDGICRDKKLLYVTEDKPFKVEFKTYNDARFKKLVKVGVQESDPKYYGQVQGYLHYEPRLAGCLFCAVNKNDDDLHFQWLPHDRTTQRMVDDRAEAVINARTPPPGIARRRSDYRCKFCDFKDNCFDTKENPRIESIRSCRSCIHASPSLNAQWECELGKEYGELCDEWEDCNQ